MFFAGNAAVDAVPKTLYKYQTPLALVSLQDASQTVLRMTRGEDSHLTAPVDLRKRPGQLALSGKLPRLRAFTTGATLQESLGLPSRLCPSATMHAPGVSLQGARQWGGRLYCPG
jgi:hypothetical protein